MHDRLMSIQMLYQLTQMSFRILKTSENFPKEVETLCNRTKAV